MRKLLFDFMCEVDTLSSKVEICGIDTNSLPKFSAQELADLMQRIKEFREK